MKKYKRTFIAGAIIISVLAFVFWYGGNAPGLRGWVPGLSEKNDTEENNAVTEKDEAAADENVQYRQQNGNVTDIYMTAPIPDGMPLPLEPQKAVISDRALTCTLSVRCDTVLKNTDMLDGEKADIIPENGIIFAEKTVTFYEGESVFNLLLREMKTNGIHMEFVDTPIYNSAYIEGIANLYEFDCGELSGWMYRVNGWFPNYGCSRYSLKEGDMVEWVYTCSLGADVRNSHR